MKTFIAATFASVAVAALANSFSPVIGVTEITATSQNTIIPIPYKSLANSANNVTLADLVRTTGLPVGTWLLAFNGTQYESWKLEVNSASSSWTPVKYASSINMGETGVAQGANTKEFAPGGAFWIVLPNAPSADGQKIYVYGSYSNDVTSKVPAGKTMLVANPKQGAATPAVEGAVAKDQMVCIKSGVVTTYTYDGTKWGRWVTTTTAGKSSLEFVEGLPELEVGDGFWYKSKKSTAVSAEEGSSAAADNVTITWTSVQN